MAGDMFAGAMLDLYPHHLEGTIAAIRLAGVDNEIESVEISAADMEISLFTNPLLCSHLIYAISLLYSAEAESGFHNLELILRRQMTFLGISFSSFRILRNRAS